MDAAWAVAAAKHSTHFLEQCGAGRLAIRFSLAPSRQLAASPRVQSPPVSLPAFQLVKLGIIAYKLYKPFTKSKLNNCKVL